MTSDEPTPVMFEPASKEEAELLDCLRKIGKGLIASGTAVGVVENTLTEIAFVYNMDCEVMALPNVIMLKLGHSSEGKIDFAVQSLTTLQLDKVSEFLELVDQVKQKKIPLELANHRVDQILKKTPRFGQGMIILGYFLSCIGLTMLYRPDLQSVMITGAAGILVGLITIISRKWPRFDLLLPVFAAIIVSYLIFSLTKLGYIFGPANLLITPLIIFLPGALLTTGMIELASKHILSGSARLIYGLAVLLLLFVGIAVGMKLSGLPHALVYPYEAAVFPWFAPILGTFLFGIGTFIRLSGSNRDLFWMLLVLYIAMVGQTIGERFFNSYMGVFIGAMLMALSSEIIARSPKRTPALVSQMLAFWFLVPGAIGLLSMTRALTESVLSAAIGFGEMLVLIIAISLGVLLGTLLISPNKFTSVTSPTDLSRK